MPVRPRDWDRHPDVEQDNCRCVLFRSSTAYASHGDCRHDDTHAGGGASGGGANGNTSTGRTDGTRTADGPEETNADSVPSDFLSSLQSPLESSLIVSLSLFVDNCSQVPTGFFV